MSRILIIGAGISGLSIASHLLARSAPVAPHNIKLLDKFRTVGGRLSTRTGRRSILTGNNINKEKDNEKEEEKVRYDTGHQYFTVSSPLFRNTVQTWESAHLVTKFKDGFQISSGSAALPAHLASQLTSSGVAIHTSNTVIRVSESVNEWRVYTEEGFEYSAETLVFSIPAPQTHSIMINSGIDIPALADIKYDPCVSLLLDYGTNVSLPSPEPTTPEEPIVMYTAQPTPTSLLFHFSPSISRKLSALPVTDLMPHATTLLSTLPRHHLLPTPLHLHSDVKKWKYAFPQLPRPEAPQVYSRGPLKRIFFAGDAFVPRLPGPRAFVEAIFIQAARLNI